MNNLARGIVDRPDHRGGDELIAKNRTTAKAMSYGRLLNSLALSVHSKIARKNIYDCTILYKVVISGSGQTWEVLIGLRATGLFIQLALELAYFPAARCVRERTTSRAFSSRIITFDFFKP